MASNPNRAIEGAAPARAVPDALRVQVSAVAAQQIAIDEEEIQLAEERTALEHQQQHFAAHVEEKRRQLLLLNEQIQVERAVLREDQLAHARQVARATGDLSQPQRELLEAEKRVQQQRQRLAGLYDKLRRRWHRHWKQRQQQYIERQRAQVRHSATLEQRASVLQDQEGELQERRLRVNGEAELSRQQLKEAWGKLRRAQFRWKHRRGLERAALRVRGGQVDAAAQRIAEARVQLAHDQRAWQVQRQALELELDGVNSRVQNQRTTLNQQETRLRWLDDEIYRRQQQLAGLPVGETAATSSTTVVVSVDPTVAAALLPVAAPVLEPAAAALVDVAKAMRHETTPPADAQRIADLNRVVEELADQRRLLGEAWDRLLTLHEQWHAERSQLADEMEAHGQQLLERDQVVQAREQANAQVEDALRQRHGDLTQAQQQLIAWGTQLRIDENAWAVEKARLLAELDSKDTAAAQQQTALSELRQRWGKRRKHEVDQLECQRIGLGALRKEIAKVRLHVTQRAADLDEEKRILAEKALALHQYHVQVLGRADESRAKRRLERLRRRWLTNNAEAIRRTMLERNALHAELDNLEERSDALERRALTVAERETALADRQAEWDQQELQTQSDRIRMELEFRQAQSARLAAEQQLAALRDEIEGIIRALLDQSDPPSLSLEQAA